VAEGKKPIRGPDATPGNTSIIKQSTNHKQDSVHSKLHRGLLSSDCGVLKSETSVPTLQSNLIMEAAGSSKNVYALPPDKTASHYKAATIFTDVLPRISIR
jgi:hypothetical protein